MNDRETGRALWLSLGDPFRMGWFGAGAGTALLIPYLLPLVPRADVFVAEGGALPAVAVFVAYWLFMAPGILRLLGDDPGRATGSSTLLSLVATAATLLAVDWIVRLVFDAVLWPSGFPLTGAAFHLSIIAIAFLKDACMIGAARGGSLRAAVRAPARAVRGPNLAIAYALVFFVAFLLNPWGGPWIGHFLPPLSTSAVGSEIVRYLSLLVSIHLILSMTALVARGTRGDDRSR